MASIEKRVSAQGETSYRVKVRLRGQPVQSATFKRLTDAKRWAAETEAAIREGRHFKYAEAKRHTLGEAIERYRSDVLPRLKDARGRDILLRWWEKHAGRLYLADLTPAKIVEFRDTLKRTPIRSQAKAPGAEAAPRYLSDARVNRYLSALSPVLTACASEWGWMDSNPCERVRRGPEGRGRVRFLSDAEREALLRACKQSETPELYTIVLIAITTGARRGEIMNLRWRDVDLARKTLTLRETKNSETRSVPLVGPALEAMKDYSKVRPINDMALVFPGRSTKTQDKPLAFERAWRTAITRAGLDDFRFHDLRHTAASYLAMNGAGLRDIAEILGHKTLAMVMRYSHLTKAHQTALVERMAHTMFGGAE